jgi:hypothetical protein
MNKIKNLSINIVLGILFIGIVSFMLKAMWVAAKFGWNLL